MDKNYRQLFVLSLNAILFLYSCFVAPSLLNSYKTLKCTLNAIPKTENEIVSCRDMEKYRRYFSPKSYGKTKLTEIISYFERNS